MAVAEICDAVAANSRDGSEIYCFESQLALRDSRLEDLRRQMGLAAKPTSLPDGVLDQFISDGERIGDMQSSLAPPKEKLRGEKRQVEA